MFNICQYVIEQYTLVIRVWLLSEFSAQDSPGRALAKVKPQSADHGNLPALPLCLELPSGEPT